MWVFGTLSLEDHTWQRESLLCQGTSAVGGAGKKGRLGSPQTSCGVWRQLVFKHRGRVRYVGWKRFAKYSINVRWCYHHHYFAQGSGSWGTISVGVENKRNTILMLESIGWCWRSFLKFSWGEGWGNGVGKGESAHFFFHSNLFLNWLFLLMTPQTCPSTK